MESKLEIIWMTESKIELFYYMLWKILYSLPIWIRYGIELLVLLLCGCLALWAIKRIGYFGIFFFEKLFGYVISGVKYLISFPFDWKNDKLHIRLTRMDDQLNLVGSRLVEVMQKTGRKMKEKKIITNQVWKWGIIIFVLLETLAIMPQSKMVQSFNPQYKSLFLFVQNQLNNIEDILTPEIERYPELYETKEESTEEVETVNYLELNEKGKTGANIRKDPSLDADSVLVINADNTIQYLGERQFDGTKYWLKVQIDNGLAVGWLSENLVDNVGD